VSVIAVASDGTRCCMAADSQIILGGSTKATIGSPKIMRLGPLLVGADGTLAMGDAFRYHGSELQVPETLPLALSEWVARVVVPWLRAYCKSADLMEKGEDGALQLPAQTLIAYKSEFCHVDYAGAATQLTNPWWAIGSGGAVARGAMFESANQEHVGTDEIVLAGVRAACEFDLGCSLPAIHLWTEP